MCPQGREQVSSHLHEMFGRRYAVIGSAVGESLANGIGQPEAGTLEARFTSAPGPVRFIPTHQGQGLPAEEIAALPIRSGSKKNGSYVETLGSQSFTDFDWFAVLDTTAYTRGGVGHLSKAGAHVPSNKGQLSGNRYFRT